MQNVIKELNSMAVIYSPTTHSAVNGKGIIETSTRFLKH